METLEFIYGIIVLIAIFVMVIGVAGLHYDFKEKEDKIEDLQRQLYELRKKNIDKARKERNEKKKLADKTKSKTVSKSRGRV